MATGHRSIVKDPAKAFISTWRTSTVYTGSTANNQIKLPLEVAGTYKFTVQWGDGTSSLITVWNQAETTHTYPAPGDYTVTITGFIKGWDFGQGGPVAPTTGDMRKLLTITQFGCLRLVTHLDPTPTQFWGTFYGCTNLTLTGVTDMPNFKGTVSTHGFLRLAASITNIPNINKWDVSKIQIFRSMLREMPLFDGNIGNWNTRSATNFIAILAGSYSVAPYGSFNNGGSDSIKNWNTSNLIEMATAFGAQPLFNQEIGNWDVSNVTNMTSLFQMPNVVQGIFNNAESDSIKNWNTSKVTTMASLFYNQREFNQEVGLWNVSNVTNLRFMFASVGSFLGKFNNAGSNSIKNWNTSKVTDMSSTFQQLQYFDQEIGIWDVSKVTSFFATLYCFTSPNIFGKFNNGGSPSINNWNLSSALSIDRIFFGQSLFNQPINGWNTTTVTNMGNPFTYNYAFNQPIGNWNVSNVTNFSGNFMNYKTFNDYSAANYDALLIGWASRPVKPNLSINFNTIKRTDASTAARGILTSAPNNWTITDGGI